MFKKMFLLTLSNYCLGALGGDYCRRFDRLRNKVETLEEHGNKYSKERGPYRRTKEEGRLVECNELGNSKSQSTRSLGRD